MPPIPVAPLSAGLDERMIDLRRTLHRNPEVGLFAPQTQASVINALRELPVELTKARGSSSVVAMLRAQRKQGQSMRRPIVHRALMGAAPLEECTTEPFASRNGAVHAEGADLQTATLIGAVSHLCETAVPLLGDVMCVFQAGEPGQGALDSLLDDGLFELLDEAPAVVYGARYEADTQSGIYRVHRGQATAEVAAFRIKVYRYGSPFERVAVDTQRVAALIVRALYGFVGPKQHAHDARLIAGILNVSFSLGVQSSETVVLVTCASADARGHPTLVRDLGRVALTVAAAENALAVVGDVENISAVHNDAAAASLWANTASAFALDGSCHLLERPVILADDLSLLLAESPGAVGLFGAASPVAKANEHSGPSPSATVFDESAMSNVARFLASLTRAVLS